MGTKQDSTEEEEIEVYSFHHLLFLEFIAAKFVQTADKVIVTS